VITLAMKYNRAENSAQRREVAREIWAEVRAERPDSIEAPTTVPVESIPEFTVEQLLEVPAGWEMQSNLFGGVK
jgi:hypothetical protein